MIFYTPRLQQHSFFSSAMDTSFSGPLLVNDGWPWERSRERKQKDACGDHTRDNGWFHNYTWRWKIPHFKIMALVKKEGSEFPLRCWMTQSVLHLGSEVFTRYVAAISFY